MADDNGMLHVGAHCALKSCKQVDFLPFKCSRCFGMFCKDHAQPWNHSCSNPENSATSQLPSSSSSLASKVINANSIKDLPSQKENDNPKSKTTVRIAKERQLEAFETFKRSMAATTKPTTTPAPLSSSSSSSSSSPSKSLKSEKSPVLTEKQIEIQKQLEIRSLRRLAKPLNPTNSVSPTNSRDPTHVDSRLFFYIAFVDDIMSGVQLPSTKMSPVWSDPELSLGRILDLVATFLKIPNNNNTLTDSNNLLFLFIPHSTNLDLSSESVTSPTQIGRLFGPNSHENHIESLSQHLTNNIFNDTHRVFLIRGDVKFR